MDFYAIIMFFSLEGAVFAQIKAVPFTGLQGGKRLTVFFYPRFCQV